MNAPSPARSLARRMALQWAAAVLLLALVLGFNLWFLREQALAHAHKTVQTYTAVVEGQTSRLLSATRHSMQLAALRLEQLQAQGASDAAINEMLRQQIGGEVDLAGLWFMNPQGTVLWDSHEHPPGLSLADRTFFRIHQDPRSAPFFVDGVVQSRRTGRWQFTASLPVRSKDGALRGVIAADIEPKRLAAQWQTLGLGEGGSVALLNTSGALLMRAPFDPAVLGQSYANTPLFQSELPKADQGLFLRPSPVDGHLRLYAYRTLNSAQPLVMIVGMREDIALQNWQRTAQLALALALLTLMGGTALAWLLYRNRLQRQQVLEQAQLSDHALAAISQGVLISDALGRTVRINRAFEELTGYPLGELLGRPCSVLQGPATSAETVQAIRQALQERRSITCEILNYRKDGGTFWNELTINPIRNRAGELTHFVGVQRNISQRKEATRALQLTQRVFEQAREGITVTDAQANIIRVNPAFTAITGYEPDEVLGKNPRILQSGLQDRAFYDALWADLKQKGRWAGEIYNRRKDGHIYPEWLTISALHNEHGEVTHYVGSFADLTDLKATQSRMHRLAHYDPLTGLPNTALLQERTAQVISMVQRSQEPMSIMMLSLDHFKNINDSLGHNIGDMVLIDVAQRLQSAVREQDTVAHRGGKEFALLLPETHSDGAAHLAHALLWKLAQPFHLAQHEISLTASIGISTYPDNGRDYETLIKTAEIALHRAQASGRDNFKFYSEGMYQEVLEREQLTKALRTAAERGELQVLYQPLADLQSGHISGMEALLRWHHPELGTVSPARFIPLAEETGLIRSIGEWVLKQVCRDITLWRASGLTPPSVAVNVSPIQLRDGDFVHLASAVIQEHALQAQDLFLEVTESALMEDVERCEQVLSALKGMGFGISLDDFGTGYSSLSYLKRYPFDKVKIDQSFVRDLGTNEADLVLVKVIISMAHGLGMRVIAEGVETEAQCEIMRTQVCDEIQGYFFSRPVDATALHNLLQAQRQLPAHLLRFRPAQRSLLIVDDEPNVVSALKRLFRRDGHAIFTASSGAEGLEVLGSAKIDVIISDQRMPGMTGVEFLREAKKRYPDTIRIVLSGYTELQSVTDAINEGAIYRFLTKPWDDNQLREQIQKAFEHMELIEQNRQLDIKIRTTNQELIAANRHLSDLIDATKRQIQAESTSLAVVREALQCVPSPILGVDDQNTIIFTNASADAAFAAFGLLLGTALEDFSAPLFEAAKTGADGRLDGLNHNGQLWSVQWATMGRQSPSRGILFSFLPAGATS